MFRHIKENKYIVNQDFVVDISNQVNNLIKTISSETIKYNAAIDNELFKTILSRYLTNEFLNKHLDAFDKGVPHVIISIDIYNMDLMITISNLDDDGFAHGCMENR